MSVRRRYLLDFRPCIGISSDAAHGGRVVYSGWKLDFSRLRGFLTDRRRATEAFPFIGNLPGNERLCTAPRTVVKSPAKPAKRRSEYDFKYDKV